MLEIRAVSAEDSRRRLVAEARNLRDHLLHESGSDTPRALTASLWPFVDDEEAARKDVNAVAALQAAFQAALTEARGKIDNHTLREVLRGRSPHRQKTPIGVSLMVAVLGVILVGLTFYYTHWSSRTQFVLTEMERFSAFDHNGQVTELVELAHFLDKLPGDDEIPDLEPLMLYHNGIAALQEHYVVEMKLPTQVHALSLAVNPLNGMTEKMRRMVCPGMESRLVELLRQRDGVTLAQAGAATPPAASGVDPDLLRRVEWRHLALGCPPIKDERTQRDVDPIEADNAIRDAVGPDKADTVPVWAFQNEVQELNEQRTAVMTDAGRETTRVSYSLQAQTIRDWQTALAGKLDSVSSWVLPIIYGALGSVVYCVWRILSPSHSALGAFYTILRTAFAGLAALTLSMLLIPSNQLAMGGQAEWPLIYLLAFIFGYSIEAFINTLNHLNAAIGRLVSPRTGSTASR